MNPNGMGFATIRKNIEGVIMKKVKIPLEFLFKLFGNELGVKNTFEKDTESEKIIEQNKKYFNHIGLG
jgi:hypothetical protein